MAYPHRLHTGLAALLLTVTVALIAGQAQGAPLTQITVEGADAVRTINQQPAAELETDIDQVAPRIRHDAVSAAMNVPLRLPAEGMQAVLDQTAPRVRVDAAGAVTHKVLDAVPEALAEGLAAAQPRIQVQSASAMRSLALAYPLGLTGDTQPPQLLDVAGTPAGLDMVVSWTTDEFADGVLMWGSAPGQYTTTFTDTAYATVHRFSLPGLTMNTPYYFVVRGVDRDGNVAQSDEQSVVILPTPTPTPTYTPSPTPTNTATPTPTNTVTPTPTFTPTPPVPPAPYTSVLPPTMPGIRVVSFGGVNVRTTPRPNGSILTVAPQGAALPAIARTADDEWLLVELPDETLGWVSVAAVQTEGAVATLPIADGDALPATPTATPTVIASPTQSVEDMVFTAAEEAFQTWAAGNGEPYRNVGYQILVEDDFFADVYVWAEFRPSREADWEERVAEIECRFVAPDWQCDTEMEFMPAP